MLEQMLGSIRGYFYQKWMVKVYTKSIPEEIEIPSMYFPQPKIIDEKFTKESYQNVYVMNVKFFSSTSEEATMKADLISQSIRENKFMIPLLNPDGTQTGEFIAFNYCQSEMVDIGVAQVSLSWEKEFSYK